jgi:2'-5' RNA ligase
MLETVPAFVALNFEVSATRRLAALQRELQALPAAPAAGSVCWLSPVNLRIVVRYLGTIDAALAPGLLDPLREIAAASSPVRVQLGPVEGFPDPESARLLITQVGDPSGALAELVARIESVVAGLGLLPATHPFVAHVTLGRLESPACIGPWLAGSEPLNLESRLTELAAYLHVQKRAGTEHVALDRFPLTPALRGSQRPSKAPKASQRPSRRPRPEPTAPQQQAIPGPPRVPAISLPGQGSAAPQPPVVPAPPGAAAALAGPPTDASTARAAGDGLPPEDEWG